MVQGWVCHTTTYVQATGSPGDRQLQEAQAQEEATACCLEDQRGNQLTPPRALHHTRLRWDRLTQPPGCVCAYVCVCGRTETLPPHEWLFRTGSPCNYLASHTPWIPARLLEPMDGWLSPASPRGPLPRASGRNSRSAGSGGGRAGGHRADPGENGLSKTRPRPEQHQAFKQKPPELASGSLSPPYSVGTEATPDLTLLSAPQRVQTLRGPQMSLACHRCGTEVPV